jgi:type IV pilus assembly protein PilA
MNEPRKGLALWSLILGVLGLPTVGCLGVGAIAAIVLGVVALVKINNQPNEYTGKGMAITGIVTGVVGLTIAPFVIGIFAAIAIPSLLRARVSANEAAAIGDIRTVISGEVAYSVSNGNRYDTLPCLAAPSTCLSSYAGPAFLDPALSQADVKSGYRRSFHPGAPATDGQSPSSMMSFAYTAVPVTSNQTGVRGFCGDDTGRICYTRDGSEPAVADGRCAEPCDTLD